MKFQKTENEATAWLDITDVGAAFPSVSHATGVAASGPALVAVLRFGQQHTTRKGFTCRLHHLHSCEV